MTVLERLLLQVRAQYADPSQLQIDIDEKMAAYSADLEKRRSTQSETDTEVDADGFVIVRKQKKRSLELTNTRIAKPGSRPKKPKRDATDFYKSKE